MSLTTAFRSAGFESAVCLYQHSDGFCDIALDDVDVLHVREENGRITWVDFTHTTDLGPVDGSEIKDRIERPADQGKV